MEGDVIIMQDVFKFEQTGLDSRGKVTGSFVFTGVKPKFVETLTKRGYNIPSNLFA